MLTLQAPTPAGFSRLALALVIALQYQRMYQEEAETTTLPVETMKEHGGATLTTTPEGPFLTAGPSWSIVSDTGYADEHVTVLEATANIPWFLAFGNTSGALPVFDLPTQFVHITEVVMGNSFLFELGPATATDPVDLAMGTAIAGAPGAPGLVIPTNARNLVRFHQFNLNENAGVQWTDTDFRLFGVSSDMEEIATRTAFDPVLHLVPTTVYLNISGGFTNGVGASVSIPSGFRMVVYWKNLSYYHP